MLSATALLAVTACSTTWATAPSSPATTPVASIVNPADAILVPPYTLDQQHEAARELAALPPGAVLHLFIRDYGVMRKAVRAAQTR